MLGCLGKESFEQKDIYIYTIWMKPSNVWAGLRLPCVLSLLSGIVGSKRSTCSESQKKDALVAQVQINQRCP